MGVLRFGGDWVVEGLNKCCLESFNWTISQRNWRVSKWDSLGACYQHKESSLEDSRPFPTDSGQAVCASFLSHLLICGEHSGVWSGSNLTFQTHCIPGCSGCPGHLIPDIEPGSTGPGGGSSSSSWMPRLPGQLRKLQGRSPLREPCLDLPAACRNHWKGAK